MICTGRFLSSLNINMKTQSQSKKFEGQCKFCSQEFSKRQIAGHLEECGRRSIKAETVLGLRLGIYDNFLKEFWLIVETDKSAKFKDLDDLIRDVWVECCGHLSSFGGYGSEVGKARVIFDTLRPGSSISYIYDFGSSTELVVKAMGYTNYKLTGKKHIESVARNYMPLAHCVDCGTHAFSICAECGEEQLAFLCEKCVTKHEEKEHCVLEIANSPRSGVCGYEPTGSLEKLF